MYTGQNFVTIDGRFSTKNGPTHADLAALPSVYSLLSPEKNALPATGLKRAR